MEMDMSKFTIITTIRNSDGTIGTRIDTKARTEGGVFAKQSSLVPHDRHQRMGDFFIAFDISGAAFSVNEHATPDIDPVWTCEGMRNDRVNFQIPALRRMLKHEVARRHPHYQAIKAAIARELREWQVRA